MASLYAAQCSPIQAFKPEYSGSRSTRGTTFPLEAFAAGAETDAFLAACAAARPALDESVDSVGFVKSAEGSSDISVGPGMVVRMVTSPGANAQTQASKAVRVAQVVG